MPVTEDFASSGRVANTAYPIHERHEGSRNPRPKAAWHFGPADIPTSAPARCRQDADRSDRT